MQGASENASAKKKIKYGWHETVLVPVFTYDEHVYNICPGPQSSPDESWFCAGNEKHFKIDVTR